MTSEDPDASPGHAPEAGMVGGRNLTSAIVVGVVLAGTFIGSLFWHPAAFTVVVAGLMVIAFVESSRVLREADLKLETPVLIVSTMIMLLGAYQAGHAGQAVGVAVLVLGGMLWMLGDPGRRDVVRNLSLTLLFGLWVGFLASYGVLLVNHRAGVVAVLAVAGAAILTDIGGYAFGVSFGRHKVAPSVSPNKTWEGLLGGVLVAVVGAVLVLPRIDETFDMVAAAVIALTCGLAGFMGDLLESMIKRDLGVKDRGRVLPGHGGILDRVDGILLALPVGYYAVELMV
jgi:phosphatidate cytidylyltransferase